MNIYDYLFYVTYTFLEATEGALADQSVSNKVHTAIGLISIIETINIISFKTLEPIVVAVVFLSFLAFNAFVFYRNDRFKKILKAKVKNKTLLNIGCVTYLLLSFLLPFVF